jgi:hypothetical protein
MLRDGESTKEPDSFFVPPGTIESSPVIHRRGRRVFYRVLSGRLNLAPAEIQVP